MRLILDSPRQACLNMAIDEMLVVSGQSVLRFYAWSEPSITAGYFQNLKVIAKKFQAEEKGIPVVRRLSGGGAVLHGQDLTFSLCLPVSNPFFPTDVKSSYLKINEAVRLGLKAQWPNLDYADCRTAGSSKKQSDQRVCFDSPACYDLLLHGKKVLGSSQRRIGKALLHQAAVFLKWEHDLLRQRILEGFQSAWKVAFEEKALSAQEIRRAEEMEESRYASSEWALLRERSFFS